MSYKLEETIRLNQLFDTYQELLTGKQRVYFQYYFSDNYSLSEIGDILSVSRNAVHVQIKNIVKNLENFESKLRLMQKSKLTYELIESLDRDCMSDRTINIIKQIEKVK
ncbi:MAG: sigma factor-like helix-turn-helix DNA-binding protein [Candidatus Izemoplasmatales bacterium]